MGFVACEVSDEVASGKNVALIESLAGIQRVGMRYCTTRTMVRQAAMAM
jgi:hypothetical protein